MTQTVSPNRRNGAHDFEQLEVSLVQAETPQSASHRIRLARRIWNERRFVRKQATRGCLLGFLLAFLLPVRYESTARLMPPDTQSGSGGLALLATLAGGKAGNMGAGLGALASDFLGMKSTSAVFIGVLRSQTVEDRLIERLNLKHVYWISSDEDARKKLESRTSLTEDRKSGIITISVEDGNAQRAAAIAQGYVDELNKLVVDLSTSSAHRERVFLEDRLIKVKSELDQSSEDFSQFASKNKALEIREEARAMLQGAATLEGELIAAQSQLQGLRAIYTDNNVRVRSLRSRIAELRNQLNKIGGNESEPANPSNGSNNSSDTMLPSMRNLPLLGVKYTDLYRRMQINEAVFETLTQQYELAKVQEAKETPSVKVLDVPRVPDKKSFPPRVLIIGACGVLAICGAILWLAMRSNWEEMEPSDPRKELAAEMFASMNAAMPWATPNGSQFQRVMHGVWTKFTPRSEPTEDGH
jgi:capsule polysaccharide export protein KpsE/RkpR